VSLNKLRRVVMSGPGAASSAVMAEVIKYSFAATGSSISAFASARLPC
jgi:hypothetical protein